MGLDIFIYKTNNQDYYDEFIRFISSDVNEDFDYGEEVCYFRKLNMLIPFLSKTVGVDPETNISHAVPKNVFEKLISTIDEVLSYIPANTMLFIKNPSEGTTYDEYPYSNGMPEDLAKKCAELLPTQGGFFFGDTSYDIGYIWSLFEIKNKISDLLKTFDESCFYHFNFWW